MARPAWLKQHLETKPKFKDQITVLPTMPRNPQRPYYTGAGKDGIVQPMMPAAQDQTQVHEGEEVIPAKTVAEAGGPQAVRRGVEMMTNRASGENTTMPKVTGYCNGGVIRKFSSGGTITTDPTTMPSVTSDPGGVMAAADAARVASKTIMPPVQTPEGSKATMQANRAAQDAALVTPAGSKATMQANRAAQDAAAAANPLTSDPGGLMAAGAASRVAAKTAMPSVTSDPGGVMAAAAAAHTAAKANPPTVVAQPAAAPANAMPDLVANQMLRNTTDMANGKSQILKNIANNAFATLNPQLQTQMTLTAMRIANDPNMTEGAKRTAMAEQLLRNGVAQSDLANQMAGKAMDIAVQATSEAYNMATGERSWNYQQATDKLNAMITAKDYKGAAAAANDLYGTKIDYSAAISDNNIATILNSTSDLAGLFQSGQPVTLATPAARMILQKMWDADPANTGKPMDEDWARGQLTNIGQTMSPAWQFKRGIDNEAALGWFGGDTTRLDSFSYGGQTGLPAFQNAMYAFHTGGAVALDANGNFTFNDKSPIWQTFMTTMGMGGTGAAGTGTGAGTTPAAGTEGQKRDVLIDGASVNQTFHNGAWYATSTLPKSVTGAAAGTTGTPKAGDTKNMNGNVYKFDGKTWVKDAAASSAAASSAGASIAAAGLGTKPDQVATGSFSFKVPVEGSGGNLFVTAPGQPVVDANGDAVTNPDNGNPLIVKDFSMSTGSKKLGGYLEDSKTGDVFKVYPDTGEQSLYSFEDYQTDIKTDPNVYKVPLLEALLRNDPTDGDAWQELKVVDGLYKPDGTTVDNSQKFTPKNGIAINTTVDALFAEYNSYSKDRYGDAGRNKAAAAIYEFQNNRLTAILDSYKKSGASAAQIEAKRKELDDLMGVTDWKGQADAGMPAKTVNILGHWTK